MLGRREDSEMPSTRPAIPSNRSGTRTRTVLTRLEPLEDESVTLEQETRSEERGEKDPMDYVREFLNDERMVMADNGQGVERSVATFDDEPIERPSQLMGVIDEARREASKGFVTVPDVGAFRLQGAEKPRPMKAVVEMEADLRAACVHDVHDALKWGEERSAQHFDSLPAGALSEDDAMRQIESLRSKISSLPPKDKALLLVEKHCGYEYPWWESQNSLIRLWGQLDCGIQLLSDKRLVADLLQVLGQELINFDRDKSKDKNYTFAYLTENLAELKLKIREKYPETLALLASIVKKKAGDNVQAELDDDEQ